MTYTQLGVIAVVAAIAIDLLGMRTRLVTRPDIKPAPYPSTSVRPAASKSAGGIPSRER